LTNTEPDLSKLYRNDDFPLSSKYDPQWVITNEMGPCVLWLTEALLPLMDLRPGMRVLDLGCGTALSSIFLARECGVEVWATDLWIGAAENLARIREAGVDDRVFPVHAEAHALPYADGFFDAIVSLDAYHYFGTDVHYLDTYLLKLVKPGGRIGVVLPASPRSVPMPLPDHLPAGVWYWLRSVDWWRDLWTRFPGVEVEVAEPFPGGWEVWAGWLEVVLASGIATMPSRWYKDELAQLRADAGRFLGFVRMVARKSGDWAPAREPPDPSA